MKPFPQSDLRRLLSTPDAELKQAFPRFPRQFLRNEKRRAESALPPEIVIANDATRMREAARLREAERLYKAAVREGDSLRKQLAEATGLPEVHPREVRIMPRKLGAREATAVVLASDWHCEERVTKESTNGLNEFNLKIFAERANYFFTNTRKLIEKESKAIAINHLVLAVIGDMFTGNIHQDLAESNLLGPMDAVALVQDTIVGGISYLLRETGLKMTVVIKPGNHSRITHKQRVQTEHENSLEWLMGHSIAKYFEKDPRIAIVRDKALLTYVDIYGRTIRFTHGHAFKYGGGVGGITIPVNKKIAEWDKGRQAYLTMFGHLHTYVRGQRFVANGSLIGYGPFSEWIGAAYEPPMQAFTLIDSKFGRTVEAPILLEDA